VITPKELDKLITAKGLQAIYLSQPTRTVVDNVDNMNWSIDSTSLTKLSSLDFSLSNIAIVTKYEDLKYEEMLAFVGNFEGPMPNDGDYILLGLFLTTTIDPQEELISLSHFSDF